MRFLLVALFHQVDQLFFTDSITFTITAIVDPDFVFQNKASWRGTTPLQVAYQMTDRVGSTTPAEEYLSEPIQFVTYSFTVTPIPDGRE